jgi:hypothetical protein
MEDKQFNQYLHLIQLMKKIKGKSRQGAVIKI